MAECLRCGATTAIGGLCRNHAEAIAVCDDITAEQIVAQPIDDPQVWLIDQWGATHGLGEIATLGRSRERELALLHHSVSALHAQIEAAENAVARVIDRGSLNGTFVNGERVRSAKLFDGDIVGFGDLRFFFTTAPLPAIGNDQGTGRTVPSKANDVLFSVRIQAADRVVELIQGSVGGIARADQLEIELGELEFGLLQTLVERRAERRDPALSFVSSRELATALSFQSVDADSDNVRELVRRVRRKIKGAGLADLIESRQGSGYRLGWPVKS